ncbi:MAG: hypothetical protein ACYC0U_00290 [Ilumatobacteraceae bacterium]
MNDTRPEIAARRFISAVSWGEHRTVWSLLSERGRMSTLDVAVKGGLDRLVAQRIGAGSALPEELDAFLGSLVHGLRADFENLDIDKLVVTETDLVIDSSALLDVVTPAFMHGETWPVGQFQMVFRDGQWAVESFRPHRTLS